MAVSLEPDSIVHVDHVAYRIVSVLSLTEVMAVNAMGEFRRLSIKEIALADAEPKDPELAFLASQDLLTISDEQWKEAQARLDSIAPVIAEGGGRKIVQSQAHVLGIHAATLYRWIKLYDGTLRSLVPKTRGNYSGATLLDDRLEKIVAEAIDHEYLKERNDFTKLYRAIQNRCRAQHLEPPHENTVRRRVNTLKEKLRVARRKGKKKANEQFSPSTGTVDKPSLRPLSLVMIDHTRANVVIVDDIHRLPIGRPWLTLAIDVRTRCVPGFYISFVAPSALSVGLCMTFSILPKEQWLIDRGLDDLNWPIWGAPGQISVDNGKDFHSKMFRKACEDRQIDLTYRPKGKPQYGGMIESLMGKTGKLINNLDGSTFSNVIERGDYDSEGNATLTLGEFERWFTHLICGIYHNEKHDVLNMPPIRKFERCIQLRGSPKSKGLPARPEDPEQLRLDFLPYEMRTVARYGIVWDGVKYYSDELRRWIGEKNPDGGSKFLVRRDPRDISFIYFWDPEIRQYFEIPYADMTRPVMSLWELNAAKKALNDAGYTKPDEDAIFRSFNAMCAIEAEAREATGRARKKAKRVSMQEARKIQTGPSKPYIAKKSEPALEEDDDLYGDDLKPFNADLVR